MVIVVSMGIRMLKHIVDRDFDKLRELPLPYSVSVIVNSLLVLT